MRRKSTQHLLKAEGGLSIHIHKLTKEQLLLPVVNKEVKQKEMRQLILKIPQGHKESVNKAIEGHQAKNTIHLETGEHDVFIVFLPNNKVDDFIKSTGKISGREISIIPRGIIALYPPESEAPDQMTDVHPKSSFEIYLGGIQSVGSMFGLVGYSLVAGIIVWIGLTTTTSYLLVAAMLVAPFAGPAMNAALATAAGKKELLKSSLMRYSLAIVVGIATSFFMTAAFSLQGFTPLMIEVSHVSKYAMFLPLVSGFAGAINICQSERDSLVSGAAVGILVAASLAPPVGLVGIGMYFMDKEIILSSLFNIVLQLVGIHVSATLTFYCYGKISPDGIRFLKGDRSLLISTCAVVVLATGAMMYWQFNNPPYLQKASMSTELTEILGSKLKTIKNVEVLGKSASFTNIKLNEKPVVHIQVTVLSKDTTLSEQFLKNYIKQYLEQNLYYHDQDIHKVYQVTVIDD